MPLYRFKCDGCGTVQKKLLKDQGEAEQYAVNACHLCGHPSMTLTLGKPDARAMETADEYRGKTQVQGVEGMIEERAKQEEAKKYLRTAT